MSRRMLGSTSDVARAKEGCSWSSVAALGMRLGHCIWENPREKERPSGSLPGFMAGVAWELTAGTCGS